MSKEGLLCKKHLLDLDWDKAVAESPENESNLLSEDYANFAYARCFQRTKNHKDGSYDDVIEAASKALIKECQNNHALCIRAYGYYLNNNYEAAITDCKQIIKGIPGNIEEREKEKRTLWKTACDKTAKAVGAEQKAEAEAARKAAEKAQKDYSDSLHYVIFAYELLGTMYSGMDKDLEASENYKQALLLSQFHFVLMNPDCQPDIVLLASPLLMDAYREVCLRVKSV